MEEENWTIYLEDKRTCSTVLWRTNQNACSKADCQVKKNCNVVKQPLLKREELEEGVQAYNTHSNGSIHGVNDFGKLGYGGPCPPGGTHRYFFKVYALDQVLLLQPGATKKDVMNAMRGHILAQGELMGKYRR